MAAFTITATITRVPVVATVLVAIVATITPIIGPMGSMPSEVRSAIPMAPVLALTVPIPMRETIA